ncbi:MAG: hypothetical protein V4720_06170 [Pseudomonadota bacterium]
MATVAETLGAILGVGTLTETTLTGTADTFTYKEGQGQILMLRNPTGGALSPVINGSANVATPVDGLGSVNTVTGYAVGSIPAGQARFIPLDSIRLYLKGTISILTGTGLVAALLKTK